MRHCVVMLGNPRNGVLWLLTVLALAALLVGCGRSGYEQPQAARCVKGAANGIPVELGLSARVPSPVITTSVGHAVIVDSSFGHLVMRVPKPLPAVRADVCLLSSRGASATFLLLHPGRIGFWSSAAHASGAMDPLMAGTVVVTETGGQS